MKKNEDGTFNVTTNELGDLMKDVVKKTLEEIQPKKNKANVIVNYGIGTAKLAVEKGKKGIKAITDAANRLNDRILEAAEKRKHDVKQKKQMEKFIKKMAEKVEKGEIDIPE